MTTPEAPQAGGSRFAGALSWAVMAGYVAVVLWISAGRPPIRLRALHYTTRALQGAARLLGVAGLRAENAYRRTAAIQRGDAP